MHIKPPTKYYTRAISPVDTNSYRPLATPQKLCTKFTFYTGNVLWYI